MRKLVFLSLSLLGLFDSTFLWWMYASPSRPMVCAGTGCDVVRASSYAHLAGIPTPVFGVAMYGTLALLVFIGPLWGAFWTRRLNYALAAISGAGFVVSLFLTAIEAFVLHNWCEWCVTSAIIVTLIFALSLVEIFRPAADDEGSALALLRKYVAVVMLAILVGVPAFILLSRVETGAPPPQASEAALREHLLRPDSHFFGKAASPVTMVEFADFQCPFCGQAEKTVSQIRQAYQDRVRFVFRHFPIPNIHPNAEKAAEASECAADQGKFWQAYDKFYANQEDLSVPALEVYASGLGLDQARFDQCLSSGAMAARVQRDKADGVSLGVDRTPTFFIDGRKFVGALDYAQFAQILDKELAARGASPASSKTTGRPQAAAQRAAASQGSSSSPAADASPAGLLGGGSGSALFSAGSSLAGCSADEANQQQPNLIDTDQARKMFEEGTQALFVDVRAPADYQKSRIRGAVNVPLEELERRWSQLPKDRNIVFYESGQSANADDICASGRAAGRFLLAHGYSRDRVKVYHDGLKGWEKAGLPVESGPSSGS